MEMPKVFRALVCAGATLTTPLSTAVGTLLSMIDGAIVVMLLFEPIKARFAKPSTPVTSTY